MLSSFLLDRLLQYERVDEDSSGSYSTQKSLLVLHRFLSYKLQNSDFEFASLPDSDATVSSENSEGEVLRERERDRDGAKK